MNVTDVLVDILVVLLAAKLAAEVAERVHVPAVVGEIVAGILIGPSVLGLVGHDEVLTVLGELGVILLLLNVGLEMSLAQLGAVGRAALAVACIGVVVPVLGGTAVGAGFGFGGHTALFLGAALAATSVGITARVFADLRALTSVEARTVLGAAVADDVLGLVLLTVVVRIVSEGSVSISGLAAVIGIALAFLVITVAVGSRLGPRMFRVVLERSRSPGTLVGLGLAFALGFAVLADAADLAPIVGAFVAGVALSGTEASERIGRELTPVGHLLIPVFFLQIGIETDIGSFAEPRVLAIAGVLTVVAIAGKLVAAAGALGSPGDKWLIGLGMLPRGEVGLIFATIGLEQGVLDADEYAALIAVVLVTTLAAPPLLRWRLQQVAKHRRREPVQPQPAEGWLIRRGDVVDLAATPPDRLALTLGFDAAFEMRDARPGPALLDWLGALGDVELRWDREATAGLLAVMRTGNNRSWRFLETTGLLERALPELADAFRRRRADPFVVDPSSIMQFDLVDRVLELSRTDGRAAVEYRELAHPEWLLLAALILDVAGPDATPVEIARRLVQRLDLGAGAEQEVALLVGDSGLLRAAATRAGGLDEESVLQLAAHLDQPERARALYLLSLALGDLEPWARAQLDELHTRALDALANPELTGRDARNLVERHRAEAQRLVPPRSPAADRIQHAPHAYLLTVAADDIVRQCALIDRLPGREKARIVVAPHPAGDWRIELAARDRPGLLATVSGVLADHGLDVIDAVVATWPDGGALESFRVRGDQPEPAELERAVEAAFRVPLTSAACPHAELFFDDQGSPWYTLLEIQDADRPGLLHGFTAGLARAGISVHSARLATANGTAKDRFELTDTRGNKLDATAKEAAARAIREGVAPRRGRFRLRSGT
jgi:Kef-type K+ transport system membrane component KefB/predicted amino acid-binding ACT domain protein